MDLHQIPEFAAYPSVCSLLERHVSMQLGDVRDMLRTPLPDAGITHGCNFAACSVLCSLVSGISVSIFQPRQPTVTVKRGKRKGKKEWVGSGRAFKCLLEDLFPWPSSQSAQSTVLAAEIYDYFRNPLAHALGVQEKVAGRIVIERMDPLTDQQLTELDQLATRPWWLSSTLTVAGNDRHLLVEGFYRDFLVMMQSLARDSTQMSAAEARLAKGKVVWRLGKP